MGRCKLFLVCAGGLVMLACSSEDSAERVFERYQWRLGNAVKLRLAEESVSHRDALEVARYPSRRALRAELRSSSINLLDFLRLSDCRLQRLLGERNSSMGRLMPASQQLIYQRRFLVYAEECLQLLEFDDGRRELRQTLQAAVQLKRSESASVAWNASAASEEFQTLLSLAAGALSPAQLTAFPVELISALERLRQILEDPAQMDSGNIEAVYQKLGSGNHAGRLLASQLLVTESLDKLSQALRERLQQRPLCRWGQPTPEARTAERVLRRFFIAEVQVYLAGLDRQSNEFHQQFWQMLQPLQPWPDAFTDYWNATWSREEAGSVWNRFRRAIAQHQSVWQQLLQECGLSPGAEG